MNLENNIPENRGDTSQKHESHPEVKTSFITKAQALTMIRTDFINKNKPIFSSLLVLNFILSLFFVILCFDSPYYFVYFLYEFLSFVALIFYLDQKKLIMNKKAFIWLVPILLYSFTSKLFIYKTLPFNFLVNPILVGIFLLKVTNGNYKDILDFSLLAGVFENFIPGIPLTFSVFRQFKKDSTKMVKKSPNSLVITKNFLLGIAFALPVLSVVVVLLAESDRNFSKLIGNLFTFNFEFLPADFSAKFLMTFLLFSCFSFYSIKILSTKNNTPTQIHKMRISPITSSTFLISLNLVYFVFLYLQIKYVFQYGLFTLPPGFEYYQFAHAAFFNTFSVSLINIVIIVVLSIFSHLPFDNKLFKYNFILTFLSNTLLIFTALSRMWMYINQFGFTSLRQTATLGLILELFIMAFLLLSFKYKINFYKMSVFSILVFLIVNNLLANDFVSTSLNFSKFGITPEDIYSKNKLECFYSECSITKNNHTLSFKLNEDSKAYLELFTSNKHFEETTPNSYFSTEVSISQSIVDWIE